MGTSNSWAELSGKMIQSAKGIDRAKGVDPLRRMNKAGMIGKDAGLRMMQRRTFGTHLGQSATRWAVPGFHRHSKRTGRELYIRYSVDARDWEVTVWAVPPGPYLLNSGSRPHEHTRRRFAGKRRTKRNSVTMTHPGFKGRPFFGAWWTFATPRMTNEIRNGVAQAFLKPFLRG